MCKPKFFFIKNFTLNLRFAKNPSPLNFCMSSSPQEHSYYSKKSLYGYNFKNT